MIAPYGLGTADTTVMTHTCGKPSSEPFLLPDLPDLDLGWEEERGAQSQTQSAEGWWWCRMGRSKMALTTFDLGAGYKMKKLAGLAPFLRFWFYRVCRV